MAWRNEYAGGMEKSNLIESSNTDHSVQEQKIERRAVGQLFGIEMTAPKGMKNPVFVVIGLIAINVLLILALRQAF